MTKSVVLGERVIWPELRRWLDGYRKPLDDGDEGAFRLCEKSFVLTGKARMERTVISTAEVTKEEYISNNKRKVSVDSALFCASEVL